MPTYGYQCNSCGNEIEVFQSIKDEPLSTCESCGGALRKRIYPVGIAFKGSGFYVNDYARNSESGSSDAKTETPKADAPQAEASKTETPKAETPKPEAKPAAPAAA